jgi:hypothetical protein
MPGQIARRLRPEEEEIVRKRAELAAVLAALAELELALADLRSQLAGFEGRYLRQVGVLYAELDDWNARISELMARLYPSNGAKQQADEAREHAHQTHDAAYGASSQTREFNPSPELKRLFREVAKRIHPDLATDPTDRERRTRLMAEANRAYEAGDIEALRRILDEYEDGSAENLGEGIGAELVKIIRKISQAKGRIAQIEQELETLRQSKIAKLKQDAEEAQQLGRDLLSELAKAAQKEIERAKRRYESIAQEANQT